MSFNTLGPYRQIAQKLASQFTKAKASGALNSYPSSVEDVVDSDTGLRVSNSSSYSSSLLPLRQGALRTDVALALSSFSSSFGSALPSPTNELPVLLLPMTPTEMELEMEKISLRRRG
jgi:hypothetical protein